MKTHGNGTRRLAAFVAGVVALLTSGCLEKRVVWSPDGNRAAVVSSDGLYLCDAEGRLSALLVPQVKLAVWMPDSRRLLVTRHTETTDWSLIAPALGAQRGDVEQASDALVRSVAEGAPWSVVALDVKGAKTATLVAARHRHATELKARLSADEWRDLGAKSVTLTELLVATTDGMTVTLSPPLWAVAREVADLRPSPKAEVVAWTQEVAAKSDEFELMVGPLRAGIPPVRICAVAAGYPDWDPTGRYLLYVDGSVSKDGGGDAIVLGVLTKQQVLDDEGRILDAPDKPEYLAGMLFNVLTHVRCLRDGRVLFNAVEMALPVAAADYGGDQREQLFAVDLGRQATLVRMVPRKNESDLPQALGFFEASPDGTQIVFGGMQNEVAVLTLATGDVSRLQEAGAAKFQGVPTWRRAGEFTYVKRMRDAARPAEVVLRRGEQETVLSRSWSDAVLARVAEATH